MVKFRNRYGEQVEAEALTATQAKNEFGVILERVIRGEAVVITRHDVPKAVLISLEEYQNLSGGSKPELNSLSAEFDAELSRMQTPKSRAAMKRAFGSSAKELGRAAISAARKRG
jgi:prevent-host-death family protein